jgi:hypothetical protein
MTTPTTAELLKYSELQMAAEAFLVENDGTPKNLQSALEFGNNHPSKFTATEAALFLADWEVVAQVVGSNPAPATKK